MKFVVKTAGVALLSTLLMACASTNNDQPDFYQFTKDAVLENGAALKEDGKFWIADFDVNVDNKNQYFMTAEQVETTMLQNVAESLFDAGRYAEDISSADYIITINGDYHRLIEDEDDSAWTRTDNLYQSASFDYAVEVTNANQPIVQFYRNINPHAKTGFLNSLKFMGKMFSGNNNAEDEVDFLKFFSDFIARDIKEIPTK